MSVPLPPPALTLRDMLPGLGFTPEPASNSDSRPALALRRPGLEVTAGEVVNRFFQPAMHFGGLWQTARSLRMIEFEMPLLVESREQAIAWLSFGFGLDCPAAAALPWFEEARSLQHLLPWVKRDCEERARRAELERLRALRPHCDTPRHWMRLLLNQLGQVADTRVGPLTFRVHFDGRMLTIDAAGQIMGAPASGPGEWPAPVRVVLATRALLPRRLMTDPVGVGVWEGALEVERYRFPLIAW